jgi:NAD-dependent dihydropyrimidine dehydrogenase PreA subunit
LHEFFVAVEQERRMNDTEKRDRGVLRVDVDECKGCGLCMDACPPKVIGLSERLNHYGYRTATYAGKGCTGCGICFMVCPEPGAITVYKLAKVATVAVGTGVAGVSQCTSN